MFAQLLQTFRTLWQKHRLLVVLNGVAILLFVLLILYFLQRTSQPLVKTPQLPSTEGTVGSVKVTFAKPLALPVKQLPLYTIQNQVASKDLLSVLAPRLSLQAHPAIPGLAMSQDGKVTLSQVAGGFTAEYNNTSFLGSQTPVKLEQAKTFAEAFLQSLGFTQGQLQFAADKTEFFQAPDVEAFVVAKEADATIIRFEYQRTLENIPVSPSSNPDQVVAIFVSAGGVIKAQIPSLFYSAQKGTTTALLSPAVITSQLEKSQFVILGQLNAVPVKSNETRVVSVNITNSALQYRIDELQNVAIPYWVFDGTATLVNEQNVAIKLATPAIATQTP